MKLPWFVILCFIGVFSCAPSNDVKPELTSHEPAQNDFQDVYAYQLDTAGETIVERFPVENGYQRIEVDTLSFAYYLRNLPLKKHGAVVSLYNGGIKPDRNVYLAVIDKKIGTKDLHQCADAVMRLRAEFLYDQKRFDEIHFHFTNGFDVKYKEWMKGKRIQVQGNHVTWVTRKAPENNDQVFWQYMEQIFMYAGTLSLEKEMKPVEINDMQIGDVFITGGSPGHAIIVVDMIEDPQSNKKKFMLAQSYMPAQELQILRNPNNSDSNPWYEFPDLELNTPEWIFTKSHLKRFNP